MFISISSDLLLQFIYVQILSSDMLSVKKLNFQSPCIDDHATSAVFNPNALHPWQRYFNYKTRLIVERIFTNRASLWVILYNPYDSFMHSAEFWKFRVISIRKGCTRISEIYFCATVHNPHHPLIHLLIYHFRHEFILSHCKVKKFHLVFQSIINPFPANVENRVST